MLDTNPVQVQYAPASARNSIPLFLLHDGGGTIFNYFMLGELGRDVYGIHDPKFYTDDGWKGGLDEMARLYVTLIKSVVKSGRILLGGWSLGGLVSLTVSRLLRDENSTLTVAGIVMIDSPYTHERRLHRNEFVSFKPEFPATTPPELRRRLERRMDECRALLDGWDMPAWGVRAGSDGARACFYQPLKGPAQTLSLAAAGEEEEGRSVDDGSSVPPAVLLRAVERVPGPKAHPDGMVDVDLSRDSKTLDWEKYPYDFVKAIYEVSGHHFNVFEGSERIDVITTLIKEACTKLDKGQPLETK